MMATVTPRPAAPQREGHEPQPRLFNRDEYLGIAELGLFEGQNVELIEGEILLMSPHGARHSSTVGLVIEALRDAFGKDYWVRGQDSLVLGELSVPEPDVAVVKGTPRTVLKTPSLASLVVEVSYSTLAFDLGRKADLYAEAGIKDYWVVDVAGQRVIVHRRPARGKYGKITEHRKGEFLSPVALPKQKINVDDLLL